MINYQCIEKSTTSKIGSNAASYFAQLVHTIMNNIIMIFHTISSKYFMKLETVLELI